jgi:hypothetical protein
MVNGKHIYRHDVPNNTSSTLPSGGTKLFSRKGKIPTKTTKMIMPPRPIAIIGVSAQC